MVRKFILVYLLWWIFWGTLQILVLHRLHISWELAFIDSTISNVFLALACLCAILLYRYYQPGNNNRFYRFIFAIGITLLVCYGIKWFLQYYFRSNSDYVEFVNVSMPIRFVFSFLMLSFVTILNWFWNNIEEKSKQSLKQSELEQLAKEAELVKLRQQLQPHFLFNSLNSISALAGSDPKQARKMIHQLSDFLRGTLKKDEQEKITLSEEISHLKLYLEIEKVRFGERLIFHINCSDESLSKLLPPLILQPIVENAIKFGIYDTLEIVNVSIDAFIRTNNLYIQITNPFDSGSSPAISGTGFGLRFIDRRLFLLYAQNNLLSTSVKDHLFTTQIIIPQ